MGNEEYETAYKGWLRPRKDWGGHLASDSHTYAVFMDMPFVRLFEKADYEAELSEFIGRMRENNSVSAELSLSSSFGGEDLRVERFAFNERY